MVDYSTFCVHLGSIPTSLLLLRKAVRSPVTGKHMTSYSIPLGPEVGVRMCAYLNQVCLRH